MHDLGNLLSDLYQDIEESKRVVYAAGVDTRTIAWHDRAITNWFNILTEIKKHDNKIDELLRIVSVEFPDKEQDLRAARKDFNLPAVNTSQSALIMLHGTQQQNLELFITRMWKYLIDEIDQAHELIEVPKKINLEIPDTVNGWEIRCRDALGEGGDTVDLLVQKLRYGPVLLVVGRSPFSDSELDQKSKAVFQQFMTERLSELFSSLQRMPLAKHPLRVVFAVTYDDADRSFADDLNEALFAEYTGDGVRYSQLQQFRSVEWSHIENYLDQLAPPPNVKVRTFLRKWFKDLDTEAMSFKDLAEQLDQQLH